MENRVRVSVAIIITICFWASTFVGIRYAIQGGYHPTSLALLRYLVASLGAIPLFLKVRHHHLSTVSKKDFFWIVVIGIIGIGLYNITLNLGEVTVSAGIASFIISLVPVFSAVLAYFFLKERLGKLAVLGICISVFGVGLISYCGDHSAHSSIGIFYLLCAALCMSVYSALQKPFLKRINSLRFTCYVIWAGTASMVIFLPQTLHDMMHASLLSTLAVVYMGIFPGIIAYALWSYVLSHCQASKAISSMYGIPFMTLLLSWLLMNEVPEGLAMFGGVIALLGAYFVSFKSPSKSKG